MFRALFNRRGKEWKKPKLRRSPFFFLSIFVSGQPFFIWGFDFGESWRRYSFVYCSPLEWIDDKTNHNKTETTARAQRGRLATSTPHPAREGSVREACEGVLGPTGS